MQVRIKVHIHGDRRDVVVRRRDPDGYIRQIHYKDVAINEVPTKLAGVWAELDALRPSLPGLP